MKKQYKMGLAGIGICATYQSVRMATKWYEEYKAKQLGISKRRIKKQLGIKPQLYMLSSWCLILLAYNSDNIKHQYVRKLEMYDNHSQLVKAEASKTIKYTTIAMLVSVAVRLTTSYVLNEELEEVSANQELVESYLFGKNGKEMILFAVVVAPAIEEYVFRYAINGQLLSGLPSKYRIVIGSTIFSLMHVGYKPFQKDLKHAVYLTSEYIGASVVLSTIYEKEGTIMSTIPVHVLINGIGVGALKIYNIYDNK